jgi:hypothetical protein
MEQVSGRDRFGVESRRMPNLVHHEFTFGDVPCVVMTSESPPVATMDVIVRDGHALRTLVDNSGRAIRFVSERSTAEVLLAAMDYLQTRFGQIGPARRWDLPLTPGTVRTVLIDQPFRPSDTY